MDRDQLRTLHRLGDALAKAQDAALPLFVAGARARLRAPRRPPSRGAWLAVAALALVALATPVIGVGRSRTREGLTF